MAGNYVSVSARVEPVDRATDRAGRGPKRAGRPQRFAEAVEVCEPTLTRLAERLCGSHADARDLVQDTYERALRAWDRLPDDANVRGWLVTILHNLFLDRCRRASRTPHMDGARADQTLDVASPETTAPQPWAELTADQVLAAVAQLEAEFRRAYELHALEGRTYRQIADELGIPTSTVGTRLLRARIKLKRILLLDLGGGREGETP